MSAKTPWRHFVLPRSIAATRSLMAMPSRNALSASSSSPCASSISPILLWDTDRSCCHCIAAIGRGQALHDGKAVAVGFERLLDLSLRLQHVTHSFQGDRKTALLQRIAGIGRGQSFDDREAIAVGLECVLELALQHQRIADLMVS